MINGKKIVALCTSRIQEYFTHDFILLFSEALKNSGYQLFVYNACSDLSNEESKNNGQRFTYDLIDYAIVDVLIVYEDRIRNQTISDAIIANGLKNNVPVIVLGDPHEGCVNIKSDDAAGMEKMVRHLICDHGVRDLHFIAGIQGEHYSDERISAFCRVLKENDIPFDRDTMLSYGNYWSGATEAVVEKVIASGRIPKAFVCVNDITALSVCGVLKRHGIRIPEDVKVTGYDGSIDTRISNPTVTTANCSIQEYTEQTVQAINRIFDGERKEATIHFTPELWKFESCGCEKQSSLWLPEYIITFKDSLYRFQSDNLDFAEISAKLNRSENLNQLSKELLHGRLYDICVVLDKAFLNDEIALTDTKVAKPEKEYLLLFDSEEEQPFVPRDFQKDNIHPNLTGLMEDNRTFLFSALTYLDVPMGYLCFSFRELTVSSLLMMPQIATFVGAGIGGYVNLRHEHYLKGQIEKMYQLDSLTGLYNRMGFSKEYQKLLVSSNEPIRLTVMLADVDSLKQVNDRYGHAAGDVAICMVADALRYACPKDALLVRFGGDEMMAVCQGEQDINKVKKRFYDYLMHQNETKERPYDINASIGIYVTESGDKPEFEKMVISSDRLMYMEKEKRKAERDNKS